MPIRWAVLFARDKRTAAAVSLLAAWLLSLPLARAQTQACTPVMARVVSLQGTVELRSAANGQWERVKRLDTFLCKGDRLRTGPNSRAALFIPSENLLRVDQNTTVSVHVEQDETVVEFFIDEKTRTNACGAGYAISRFPRKFKINTPFSYAAVEGTEFLVALSCTQATVSVFEGRVSVVQRTEQATKVLLGSGQTTSVGPGQPPVVQVLVKPTDAVQWALFYPPLADPQFGADPLHAPCESLAGDKRAACLLERAEALVRVGQVNEAQADIRDLLALEPNNGDAFALRAVISVVRNEKTEALRYAQEATRLSPNAFRPWLALSYAQQANFDLEQALESARKAAALAPASALAMARVAELLMSLGRIREAETAARHAVEVDPNQSRGYVILGFVQLAAIDTKSARQSFRNAIELDSTDPLPRLGLGLAIIRDGRLEEGRAQIEIAVALDPTNSLMRSYLGKAYYEENTRKRDQLAASQYSLAKELDPKDPTPWFYDAILKQTQNQPAEALEELQRSIALNNNRAVYRSRLLLDEDKASRQVNVATTYRDLGMIVPAQRLAAQSATDDPSNSFAHRFLAEAYADLPRYEVAASSELLQAQMLQPLNSNPVPPQLAFTDLSLPTVGAFGLNTLGDYTTLFERNGARLSLGALAGNLDTYGSEIVVSGLLDRVSGSVGRFGYSTQGFRQNDDLDHEIYNAFVQFAPSPSLSLQAEYRDRKSDRGDIIQNFDPNFYYPNDRFTTSQQTARLGITVRPGVGSTVLGSLVSGTRTDTSAQFRPGLLNLNGTFDDSGHLAELQYQYARDRFNVVAGLGYADVDSTTTLVFDWTGSAGVKCFPPFLPCQTVATTTTRQTSGYLYANVFPTDALALTLGAARNTFENELADIDNWDPKLGVRWALSNAVTLRAAAFGTVRRRIVVDQTLEPTQIAGFNQFFDDINGSQSKTYAGGVDLRFGPKVTATFEAIQRDTTVSTGQLGPSLATAPPQDLQDQTLRFSANWIATRNLAVFLGARADRFNFNPTIPFDGPTSLDTVTVPLGLRVFYGSSWFGQITTTAVWQSVERLPSSPLPVGSDDFVVADLAIGYRLPRRYGTISLTVNNLFDTKFSYQDDNFRGGEIRVAPYVPTCRVLLRAALVF